MLELGFKALGAYLLGSVIGSLLLGALRGVDIRTQGSGNAGGTNALRTQGWAFALGVIVVDVGKALLAVGWLPGVELPGIGIDPDVDVLVAGDTAIGRLDAVLDGPDQLLTRDLLLRVELEEGAHEVSTHDRLLFCGGCRITTGPKKRRGGHPRHGAAVQLPIIIHPGAWTAQTGVGREPDWGVFSRAFALLEGGREIGSLSADNIFTRKATADLPGELPILLRMFIVWLMLMSEAGSTER